MDLSVDLCVMFYNKGACLQNNGVGCFPRLWQFYSSLVTPILTNWRHHNPLTLLFLIARSIILIKVQNWIDCLRTEIVTFLSNLGLIFFQIVSVTYACTLILCNRMMKLSSVTETPVGLETCSSFIDEFEFI